MIRLRDWREADAADVVALVQAEADAWLDSLHWDVSDSWHVIEPARVAGRLPGVIAYTEAGRPIGWTAYLRHGASLQVMALVAPTAEATRALVDRVLASREATDASVAIVCVRDNSPGIAPALVAHGFTVEPYRYLAAPLTARGATSGAAGQRAQRPGQTASAEGSASSAVSVAATLDVVRPWPESGAGVAELFDRAYAGESTVRAFAPTGARDEWIEYIGQLRKGPGCGWFLADLSVVVPREGGPDLDAALLVTHLSADTVHIAQLAVAPSARRRGLARRLVTTALERAAPRYARATLLVSAENEAACALYASLGFVERAKFVVATRR